MNKSILYNSIISVNSDRGPLDSSFYVLNNSIIYNREVYHSYVGLIYVNDLLLAKDYHKELVEKYNKYI